jgi:hypothetical protein
MTDQCPAGAIIEAFATGSLSDDASTSTEAHLARCLGCAEALERMTRAQLEVLVGARCSIESWPTTTSPVLDQVMRQASAIGSAPTTVSPDWLWKLLDQIAAGGRPGSFAGYDVLEIAGRGGMGVVLKARDRTLDRVVALKVLTPVTVWESGLAARFLEEARTVAALQHDHVVAIHQAGIENGVPYLVMPFHPEGTLEQWLRRTPALAPKDIASVGWQLARALEATHRRGIVHRDIKPSNVLLEGGLHRLRLADFGLAQSHYAGSAAAGCAGAANQDRHVVAGTPHYMSPEQARGETVDARSDLFSLGAVLFQMATGQTLYAGEPPQHLLAAAARCEIKPLREVALGVPPGLARIVDRLLARRAEDRFRSATDVASEFEHFIRAEHGTRLWVKRAVVGVLGACLALSAIVVALDGTGATAVINAWLCQRTGDGYYVRGRFGTYSRLPDVVAAANPHNVIEARFSEERLVDSFRVGGKPLTIRAAQGFTPILIATNNAQPLILVDAPLTLEGLTLWRRGPVVNFAALISVEKAPLHLLNCRVIRSGHQGQDVLVHGRLRPPTSSSKPPPYRALLAFQHGSVGHVRNCLVVGTPATAFELRASALEPTRIETDNSLFVIDRGFHLNREVETGVTLRSRNSLYFTTVMLDIDQAAISPGISAFWQNCIVDRTQGALIRLHHYGDGARLRALEWRETNMVYAGQGAYVSEPHDDPIVSEAEWNEWMQLGADDHRTIDQQFFPKTTVRSGLTLSAVDLDPQIPQIVRAGDSSAPGRGSEFIGEGKAYAAFRKSSAYHEWQEQVRVSTSQWEQRHGQKLPVTAR